MIGRVLCRLVAAGLVVAATVTAAAGQDVTKMRLSHWVPAAHPMAVFLQSWADGLREETDGRLDIEIFPGGQLGPVTEHYDMVRRGVVDIGWILHGATSDRFPLTSLIDIPFSVDSAVHGTKVLNDPELRANFLDAEHRGLKVLLLFTHQPAQIHTAEKPVLRPADLDGQRIRFPSATAKAFLDAMGATSVGLPPSAIAENLQKRVIDGVMIDYGGAGVAYKLGGLVGEVAEVNAYVTSFGLVMNPDSYERLPGDVKAVLDESLVGIEEAVGQQWDSLNEPGKAALVEGGATINVPGDAELAEFRAVGEDVADAILAEREAQNPDVRAAYARMRELAETHRQ